MLTCKDVTHLVSQSMDRKLGLPERIGLYIHLKICDGCRNFSAQLALMRRAAQRLSDRENGK